MTTYRIWPDDVPAAEDTTAQAGPYTVATSFTVSSPQPVLAIWIFSGPGSDTLPSQVGVYETLTMVLQAANTDAVWTNLAGQPATPGDGWIRCPVMSDFILQPGVQYQASSSGNDSCRSYILNWFTADDIVNGPLICLAPERSSFGQACYGQGDGSGALVPPDGNSSPNSYFVDVEVGEARGRIEATQQLAGMAVPTVSLAQDASTSRRLGAGAQLSQELVSYGAVINLDHDMTSAVWASRYTTEVMFQGHGTIDMGPGGTFLAGDTENPEGQFPNTGMAGNTPYRLRITALLPGDYIVAFLSIEWTDSGGNAIGSDPNVSFPPSAAGTWATADVEAVSPPNCVGAYLIFEILATADHIYVGQLDLQQVYSAPPGEAGLSQELAGAVTLGRIP